MKKIFLSLFLGLGSFVASAQTLGETNRNLITHGPTEWTATGSSGDPSGLVNNTTNTAPYFTGTTFVAGTTATINMGASKTFNGITITGRGSQLTSFPKTINVEVSLDGTIFTPILTGATVAQITASKLFSYVDFPTVQNAQYFRITITETYGGSTLSISELGAYTTSFDPTSYDRTNWTATSTNEQGASEDASKTIDGNVTTRWSVKWSAGTTLPFPHEIVYTLPTAGVPINQVSYVQREYAADARSVTAGNLIFSNDPTFATTVAVIPFTWNRASTGSPEHSFALGQTVTAKYIKLSATANSDDAVTSGGLLGSTCLAEFKARYNATLPVTFSSLSAKLSGSNVNVNWSTASEANNDHFEIEASTDGKTFKTVKTVQTKNGDSKANQDYEATVSVSEIAGLLAIPALLAFVGFAPLSRRRKFVTLAMLGFVAATGFVACQKEGKGLLSQQGQNNADILSGNKSVYIRIKQVDKNGTFTYSNIVVAK